MNFGIKSFSQGQRAGILMVVQVEKISVIKSTETDYAKAADDFDEDLKELARGKRQDLNKLVCRVLDKEQIDLKSLAKEEADYVKTTKVLMGQILYSDSWLTM